MERLLRWINFYDTKIPHEKYSTGVSTYGDISGEGTLPICLSLWRVDNKSKTWDAYVKEFDQLNWKTIDRMHKFPDPFHDQVLEKMQDAVSNQFM